MKETIIQFGAGNFLRGFADYFVHIMNEKGLYDGKAVIVQPLKSGPNNIINNQHGKYNLYTRGIENGNEACTRIEINSISRSVNPYEDFNSFIALAKNPDFRFIVSNTTESGIKFDSSNRFSDSPAASFPGKLTQLLFERFKSDLKGFVLFPCELIDSNGDELQKCVLKYAELWGLGNDFCEWIVKENTFCNTLVDRIVPGYPKAEAEALCKELGYDDRLLDTAEIFHLWVIEGDFENEFPLKRAGFNVVWTDNAAPYKKRKVRVLNGAHTSMVFPALLCGLETVGECMADEQLNSYLNKCLYQVIIPVLGENEDDFNFAEAVLERFSNPYIRHQLKSISLNSVSKFAVRVLPTIMEYQKLYNEFPKLLVFALSALIEYYKKYSPQDNAETIDFIRNSALQKILSNADFWGMDISDMFCLVEEGLYQIHNYGIRKAISWAML